MLGYADDLVFVPVGAYLARRAIPDEVMESARERAKSDLDAGAAAWLAAGLVILAWIVVAIAIVAWWVKAA